MTARPSDHHQPEGDPMPDPMPTDHPMQPEAPNCRGRDCGRSDCSSCSAILAWYARQDGEAPEGEPSLTDDLRAVLAHSVATHRPAVLDLMAARRQAEGEVLDVSDCMTPEAAAWSLAQAQPEEPSADQVRGALGWMLGYLFGTPDDGDPAHAREVIGDGLAGELERLAAEVDLLRRAVAVRDRSIDRAWVVLPEGLDAADDSLAAHIRAVLDERDRHRAELAEVERLRAVEAAARSAWAAFATQDSTEAWKRLHDVLAPVPGQEA